MDGAPHLVLPAEEAAGVSLAPTFTWTSVGDADGYGLYISKPPYGEENVFYKNENLTGVSLMLPSGLLQPGVKYWWNMASHGSAGWSYDRTDGGPKFSEGRYFTTENEVAQPHPGDLDGDGLVTARDAGILMAAYGRRPGEAGWNARCDLVEDGAVNLLDLVYLARGVGGSP